MIRRIFLFLMRCEAQHSCSPTRVFFFFSFSTLRKWAFSFAMISRTEIQKLIVSTRKENFKIKSVPSVIRNIYVGFVRLKMDPRKDKFLILDFVFFHYLR